MTNSIRMFLAALCFGLALPALAAPEQAAEPQARRSVTDSVGESVRRGWEATREGVGHALEVTREKTAQGWDKTREVAGDTADWTREKSSRAWEATREGATATSEWLREKTAGTNTPDEGDTR